MVPVQSGRSRCTLRGAAPDAAAIANGGAGAGRASEQRGRERDESDPRQSLNSAWLSANHDRRSAANATTKPELHASTNVRSTKNCIRHFTNPTKRPSQASVILYLIRFYWGKSRHEQFD